MRFLFCLFLMLGSQLLASPVIHEVKEDETAWFLAELYYGSGKQFPKILQANKLKRAEEIKPGLQLKIVDPKYSAASSDFSERRQKLWIKRQKALGLARPDSIKGIYIPTEQIRKRDKTKLSDPGK